MAKINPNDRYTINGLRANITEALDLLRNSTSQTIEGDVSIATTILETALEVSDPKILDKDCGCG